MLQKVCFTLLIRKRRLSSCLHPFYHYSYAVGKNALLFFWKLFFFPGFCLVISKASIICFYASVRSYATRGFFRSALMFLRFVTICRISCSFRGLEAGCVCLGVTLANTESQYLLVYEPTILLVVRSGYRLSSKAKPSNL